MFVHLGDGPAFDATHWHELGLDLAIAAVATCFCGGAHVVLPEAALDVPAGLK